MVCFQTTPQICHLVLDCHYIYLPVLHLWSVNHISLLTLVLFLNTWQQISWERVTHCVYVYTCVEAASITVQFTVEPLEATVK